MAGFKENITAFGVCIQPIAGTYVEPGTADLLAISAPDDGYDDVTAEDPTLTGAIWTAPQQFLGRRGRAGATAALRGPGGTVPPGAGGYVLGRILQAAGFTEVINATEITGTAAGGTTSSITLDATAPATLDFYKGFPIQHANIGAADTVRGTSIIRSYSAAKVATLCEVLGSAVAGGQFRIPPSLNYILSTGLSVPLLSAKVWRHKKSRRYRDCALTSFALNIPVANTQNTELPTVEFAMAGVPMPSVDETSPSLPSSTLSPPAPARAGKFTFNGLKLGHQSLRLEFGLETGALPNQNYDEGEESYEVMSGSRNATIDLNEQLKATLDLDTLVEQQQQISVQSGWGQRKGDRFLVGLLNNIIGSFSPTPRNGFVGVNGPVNPLDPDRSVALSILY